MSSTPSSTKRNPRDFKKGVNIEDGRRRREQNVSAIRKDKKEEGLSKRRNLGEVANLETETSLATFGAEVNTVAKRVFTVADIPTLLAGLQSSEVSVQVDCVRGFRRLLSLEKHAPVKQCINCGAVPFFVQFLQRHENTELQFEAAWVLTNIASSEETEVIVKYDAIPHLVNLLLSPNADIREQSAWCLGNVAGDGPKLRDIVLSYNTIAPLIQNLQNPATISLFRNCTWTLSNMCRGKPQPPLSILAPALPVLANILFQNKDIETMVDATWALSYISDGENARIQAVVDTGVVPYLTNILRSDNVQAVVPSLRTLGNIVSGDDHQTQCVLDANVLTALVPLLSHSKKNIRKETCWLLSNIAAGTFEQLTQLVNTPGLLPRVLEQLSGSSEWDVRKEACWVVSNLASVGQTAHIHDQLVEFGVIAPLCELLSTADVKVLMVAMEALESLLKMGGEGKLIRYTQLVDEAGGIDSLERLQEHENPAVYAKAVSIIENYFGGEDEGESENIAPTVVEKNGFSSFAFGLETTKATSSSSFNFGDIRNVENRDISNITNHQSAFQFGN